MLIKYTELDAKQFIKLLTEEEIVIYEDVQASKIWVNYVDGQWLIRPKKISNDPINLIDLAYQKFYKYAVSYLLSLSDEVISLLRPNLYFCFEYFPDEQPANILYDRLPKNRLILTSINKYGKKYSYNFEELNTYAKLFNVETLPVIYDGKLSDKQLKMITYFLYTSTEDVPLIFKDKDFTEFFYKLLNPFTENSYLKDGFQPNLEKIIIRFKHIEKEMTLEVLNPMYKKMQLTINSEYSNVYSLLIFNFMQYLLKIDLDKYTIKAPNTELTYISLICEIYNEYMLKHANEILDFDFSIPEFFSNDKFKVNQQLIKNKETINWINKDEKFEYLFKIILSVFRHEQKKSIGVLTNTALKYLNELINQIHIKVEKMYLISKNIETIDLDKYPNLKWSSDYKGYSYPEIDSIFNDSNDTDKKDKLKNEK